MIPVSDKHKDKTYGSVYLMNVNAKNLKVLVKNCDNMLKGIIHHEQNGIFFQNCKDDSPYTNQCYIPY